MYAANLVVRNPQVKSMSIYAFDQPPVAAEMAVLL
jgi:hypothetical protein